MHYELCIELDLSFVGVGVVAAYGDNDVVEHAEVHGLACSRETACDVVVLRRGPEIAGGMVVAHHYSLSILEKSPLHYHLGVEYRCHLTSGSRAEARWHLYSTPR